MFESNSSILNGALKKDFKWKYFTFINNLQFSGRLQCVWLTKCEALLADRKLQTERWIIVGDSDANE